MKIPRFKKMMYLATIVTFGVAGLLVTNLVSANYSGAIYTSLGNGAIVNQNLYTSKADVYLNGGPQNENGPTLPSGTYFYQVTTPNGALLSTDPAICRQLTVAGGVVAGATGPCPHANGSTNPANGSTPVQLIPFNDTTNAGGEYKVWMIRQAATTAIVGDPLTSPILSFSNSNSKTDNFKIEVDDPCVINPDLPVCNPDPQTVTLGGHKFYDANANSLDDDSQDVAGVEIVIAYTVGPDSFGPFTTVTDSNGDWSYGPIPAGASYTVSENLPCIDANNDNICDPGYYWVQTAPVADSQGFQGYSGTANDNVTGLDFGDVCFSPGSGGYTLGFWSNKNGQRRMESASGVDTGAFPTAADNPLFPELGAGISGDLNFLKRLNLKNSGLNKQGNATDFDPTGYPQFRTWLLNGNAVNMAYMLSVQLSATSLNVRHMSLDDDQIVDARSVCNNVGDCLGFETIGSMREAANTSLASNTWTISGSPHRDSQELLKNFLDAVNNNRLPFASGSPCLVSYVTPPTPTPTPTP